MGVTHKLKPEVRDFIVAEKKANADISCRSLSALVQTKFQTVISKSSINNIFKEAGLSMPVGRRQKKKRQHIHMPALPILAAPEKPVDTEAIRIEAEKKAREELERRLNEERQARAREELEQANRERLLREAEERARAEEERIRREFERKAKEENDRLEAELRAKKEAEEASRRAEEEKWARIAQEEKRLKELQEEALRQFREEFDKERKELEELKKRLSEESMRLQEGERQVKETLEQIKRKEEIELKELKEKELAAERAEKERWEKIAEEEKRKLEEEKAKQAEAEALKKHVEDIKRAEEEKERQAEEERKANLEAVLRQEREKRLKEEEERQKEDKKRKFVPLSAIELPEKNQSTGALVLKAAEYLAGTTNQFTANLSKVYPEESAQNIQLKLDTMIFSSLFQSPDSPELWPLVGKKINPEAVAIFNEELENNPEAASQFLQLLNGVFHEVRYIKIPLPDNKVLYLDGQFHSVWSSPQIPFDFSSTYFNVRRYIEKSFLQNEPLNIFMAPGYDIPTKELFDLVVSLDSSQNRINKVMLCGNKFEEIESVQVAEMQRRSFVFGLWPWQFVEHRKVNKIASFNPYFCEALNRQVYIAYIEMELTQPVTKQYMALAGFAIKITPEEKARVVVLSNMMSQLSDPASIVNTYFNHWPNLEEGFQDFSRKIESFTYTGDSQRYFSPKYLQVDLGGHDSIRVLFKKYLDILDLYVRWHFLPSGWEEKDSGLIKQRIYGLQVELNKKGNYTFAAFKLPSDYTFAKELQYVRSRINEREIRLGDGTRLVLI